MTTESSAVVRLINSVQTQPVLDSYADEAIPDPGIGKPVTPPQAHDFNTVVMKAPVKRRWLGYLVGGMVLLGSAVAVGVVVGKSGSGPELEPAANAVPAQGAALEPRADGPSATPVAAGIAIEPAAVPEATAPAVADPAAVTPAAASEVGGAEPVIAGAAVDGAGVSAQVAEQAEAPDQADPAIGQDPAGTAAVAVAAAPAIEQSAGDAYTSGFDIITEPAGALVVLDGAEIGPAPLRVGRLAAGAHVVEVHAPAGYVSQRIEVELVADERRVVEVTLQSAQAPAPTPVASGVVAEPLDVAPAAAPAARAKPARRAKPKRRAVAPSKRNTRVAAATRRAPTPAAKGKKPGKAGPKLGKNQGVLMIGAKPPCKIYIDGKNTGLITPQRAIKLKAGKHKVTLVNREHKIKVSATVRIEAGKTKRVIQDLTKRMK